MPLPPDRRRVWRLALVMIGVLSLSGPAPTGQAIGVATRLQLTQLVLPGVGAPRKAGLAALVSVMRQRTNTQIQPGVKSVTPASAELRRQPLLLSTATGALPALSATALRILRSHLQRGGTWIIDGPSSGPGQAAFLASATRLAGRLFPRQRLSKLPASHTLFKSFYLLRPAWFQAASLPLRAVRRDGRAVLIIVTGLSTPATQLSGRSREWLDRLAVNLFLYVLCVDYKSDQVHAPSIMKRRKWQLP